MSDLGNFALQEMTDASKNAREGGKKQTDIATYKHFATGLVCIHEFKLRYITLYEEFSVNCVAQRS